MSDLQSTPVPTSPTPSPTIPAPTSPTTPPPSNTLTLQVGERRFVTHPTTLTGGSEFFRRQLSGRWPNDIQPDGSHFIDADGDVFAHVLRYLRHEIMPVFYDGAKGAHEHALYLAVLEQARYFGVEPLRKWLEGQRYLEAVKVTRSARLLSRVEDVAGSAVGGHVEVEHHVSWRTRKVYVCPRGIPVHRDDPRACGKMCRIAQGDDEDEYEDEDVLKVLEVRKTTVMDPKVCIEQVEP